MRPASAALFAIAITIVLDTTACDTASDAKQTGQEVVVKGKAVVDKGKGVVDGARQLWADVPSTGHLSDKAKSWIGEDGGAVGKVISKGAQVAPVALEIGEVLAGAVESDRKIEPIFQRVEEGKQQEVDAAIEQMPRTEVIDGLTIGFKQLDETGSDKVVKERGYLVTWREGDHLIGFVYRSKSTVDIDKLVAEAPRLVALTKTAVQKAQEG
jgi:hypothetical protein